MSLKDKCVIGLLILFIVILGFVIKSDAGENSVTFGDVNFNFEYDAQIANYILYNSQKFVNTDASSLGDFFGNVRVYKPLDDGPITMYDGSSTKKSTIGWDSAVCAYHLDEVSGDTVQITDLLDIEWDINNNVYKYMGTCGDETSNTKTATDGWKINNNPDVQKQITRLVYSMYRSNELKSNASYTNNWEKIIINTMYHALAQYKGTGASKQDGDGWLQGILNRGLGSGTASGARRQ